MLIHDDFNLEDHTNYCLAVFHHSIDMDRLLTLKPLIEEQALQIRKSLLVDLTAVDFLDSAAVGVLAILYRQVYKHKLRMAFINPQPQAEAVLSMVGLSEMVPGYASKEEALSDLGL